MGAYHFIPDEDETEYSDLNITYTPETYRTMIKEVKQFFKKMYFRRYRIHRYLVYLAGLIVLIGGITPFVTGNRFYIRENIPYGVDIVQGALIFFIVVGIYLLLRKTYYLAATPEAKESLKNGKIGPQENVRYRFYPYGLAFSEPHQKGAIVWQGFHFIHVWDEYLVFDFCPENTPKGKETPGLKELIIPSKNIEHLAELIAIFSDESLKPYLKFRDYRTVK
ncbi:hypothetical protein [Morganella morganii]|uniref:hypothetical protein n=1 Tax=Morganella morganii TaxID=582 RepID=UPI002367A2C5|nr:hypothetical protein [Morganella morganii]